MEKISLNRGWQVTEGNLQNPLMVSMLSGWRDCSLPHDHQITKERTPASPTGENEGWTQGAALFYRKSFELGPEDAGKRCWLEFEGIAGVCQIWINGIFAAKHLNPYTGILFEATKYVHPGNNTIQIHVDSCMKPNSRWYVGTGLYYRDIVWGCSKGPKLFCLPPHLTGKNIARLSWGWLPVQRNYTFAGQEGQMIEVHVCADADEVELFQNGVRIGKAPCGRSEEYCAVFTLPYQPGELSAVARRDGVEIGKDVLCTAGETAALSLTLDGQSTLDGGEDLAFVTVRAVDGNGNHVFLASSELTVNVSGGGTLLALGNADPKPDRTILYGRKSSPLYEGTALAIIRGEDSREDCIVECELANGIKAQIPITFK